MEPRERMLTALSRKIPDRVPNGFEGFNREALKIFKVKTGSDDWFEYFNVDYRFVHSSPTKKVVRDPRKIYTHFHKNLPDSATINEWGTVIVPGSNPAFDHYIPPLTYVNFVEEIEGYPLPDLFQDYHYEGLKENTEKIKQKELAAVGAMACTIFEVAWQIRGFNELMIDFSVNEKVATCLLDRITELRCYQAKKFAEAGVDILILGDDIGMQDRMMMAPEMWRKWLKPRLKEIIESALSIKPDTFIFYHSDGYIEPVIADLIEIGVNVLNPVQPGCMNPAKLKKEYGDRLAFWGTIGTQTTMPFGEPEDVKKEVKERMETVGEGGGLVIAPSHSIEPEVPWENVLAFFEAVREYGTYNS